MAKTASSCITRGSTVGDLYDFQWCGVLLDGPAMTTICGPTPQFTAEFTDDSIVLTVPPIYADPLAFRLCSLGEFVKRQKGIEPAYRYPDSISFGVSDITISIPWPGGTVYLEHLPGPEYVGDTRYREPSGIVLDGSHIYARDIAGAI